MKSSPSTSAANGWNDFKMLKNYLSGQAPMEMVIDTALRLRDKACTRRFEAFAFHHGAATPYDRDRLRAEWEISTRVPKNYGGYHRQWNLQQSDEATILMVELKDWIVNKGLPQREVEQRLMAFDFV
ncbi:hypothetical protein PHYSODRAFT_468369, partial [Phytophthora sojae]